MATRIADGSGPKREYRGPVKNRSCTDTLCLVVFLVFLTGWGIVGYIGFNLGDPQRIIHPSDSQGRMCGLHESVLTKPYLFFFDLTKCANPTVLTHGCPTHQVCVESCPNETFAANVKARQIGESATKQKMICKENVTLSLYTVQQLVDQGLCASYYMESKPISKRCIPEISFENIKTIDLASSAIIQSKSIPVNLNDLLNGTAVIGQLASFSQLFERVYQDLTQTWWAILISLVLAMFVSFLWIVLMRFVAGIMVWVSILFVLGLQAFGIFYCYGRYDYLKNQDGNNKTLADVAFTTNVETYLSISQTWLIFLILLALSMGILLLALIFLRNRIRVAIALIGQGSKAIGHMMSTLVFPIFPWIFQVLVLGYFLAVLVYCFTIGQSTYKVVGPDNSTSNCSCPLVIDKQGTCSPIGFTDICKDQCPGATCQYFQFGGNRNYLYILQGYNLFGLFWGLFFVGAFAEMVLAGAFASWYWTFKKPQDVPNYALTTSFFRTVVYHMGTVAFGALIISIIRSIRVILEYIDRKVKEHTDSACSKCIMCSCKCCFWLLESFMRFINRNAYIMCAITGKRFCASAQEAFMLLMRNVVRVVVLDKVTDFLLFLGRLVVVGLIGVLSYFTFTRQIDAFNPHIPPVNYYLVPFIATIIGAYFISGIFFSVYAMAIDTIFLCFVHDSEINDGTPERPYYMPVGLMEILGKRNKP